MVIDNEIKEKAKKALNKKPSIGPDVDTSVYITEDRPEPEFKDPQRITPELKKTLLNVGVDPGEKNRLGTYIQEGNRVSYCRTADPSKVEVLPITEALRKYDWLKDYYWKAVPVDTDKFTAETGLSNFVQGYFIYAREGVTDTFPIQTCLFLNVEGMKQIVHNIIIVEKNASLNLITGCTVHPHINRSLHLGTSEFYLKEGSSVTFTMVHYWADESVVRPRTGIIQDKNSQFISNYIVLSEVKDLQSNPITYINGDNASAYFQTIIHAKGDSKIDVGARAVLNGKNTKAELISKIVGEGNTHTIARGEITGIGDGSRGHIDCSGLLISDKARIDSIPAIKALNPDISLTHEASLGKIGEEIILYLKSRGLTEDEARDLIIGGFLEADLSHLPPDLARETEKLIKAAADAQA